MKKKEQNKSIEKIPGGIISSKEGWENISEDWINRSYEERLSALEILRLQYLEMFNKSEEVDFSVFGKR